MATKNYAPARMWGYTDAQLRSIGVAPGATVPASRIIPVDKCRVPDNQLTIFDLDNLCSDQQAKEIFSQHFSRAMIEQVITDPANSWLVQNARSSTGANIDYRRAISLLHRIITNPDIEPTVVTAGLPMESLFYLPGESPQDDLLVEHLAAIGADVVIQRLCQLRVTGNISKETGPHDQEVYNRLLSIGLLAIKYMLIYKHYTAATSIYRYMIDRTDSTSYIPTQVELGVQSVHPTAELKEWSTTNGLAIPAANYEMFIDNGTNIDTLQQLILDPANIPPFSTALLILVKADNINLFNFWYTRVAQPALASGSTGNNRKYEMDSLMYIVTHHGYTQVRDIATRLLPMSSGMRLSALDLLNSPDLTPEVFNICFPHPMAGLIAIYKLPNASRMDVRQSMYTSTNLDMILAMIIHRIPADMIIALLSDNSMEIFRVPGVYSATLAIVKKILPITGLGHGTQSRRWISYFFYRYTNLNLIRMHRVYLLYLKYHYVNGGIVRVEHRRNMLHFVNGRADLPAGNVGRMISGLNLLKMNGIDLDEIGTGLYYLPAQAGLLTITDRTPYYTCYIEETGIPVEHLAWVKRQLGSR